MITALKLILFALSTVGWWELIRRHSNIDVYFIPGLTVAIQVTILFCCGLANLLPEGVYVLYFAGFVALFFSVRTRESFSSFIKSYWNLGFLFLGLMLTVTALFVRGRVITYIDNYTHWGLVVKQMLMVDRYPNFKDALITFQEYPLGSSTYVYFFAKLISKSESAQMLAQAYMMFACFLPVFSYSKPKSVGGFLVALVSMNLILYYVPDNNVLQLLVDTLLALAGISGILFALKYCGPEGEKRNIFLSAFYAIFLLQIKNSGIFFALIILAILLRSVRKGQSRARMLSVLAALASLLLWHKHCGYVFPSAAVSQHAFSLSRFRDVFAEKSLYECVEIGKAMIKFSVELKDVWLVVALFVVLGIFIALFAESQLTIYWKTLIASAILYTVYQIGLLGMYLFSMKGYEATVLTCNYRYTGTVIVAILYLYTVLSVKTISVMEANKRLISAAVSVAISASICVFSVLTKGSVNCFTAYAPSSPERLWVEAAKAEYDLPEGKSYCILAPSLGGGDYTYYVCRYVFMTGNIEAYTSVDSEEALDGINSDYILNLYQDNNVVDDWISKNYPEQAGERVIICNNNS